MDVLLVKKDIPCFFFHKKELTDRRFFSPDGICIIYGMPFILDLFVRADEC